MREMDRGSQPERPPPPGHPQSRTKETWCSGAHWHEAERNPRKIRQVDEAPLPFEFMDEDFIEAILLWREGANPNVVLDWLHSRNLANIPMGSGLLITGPPAAFDAAFGTALSEAQRPFSLPLPEAIRPHVASIQIPRLRRPHKPKPSQ
jgi:hypothetical protein